MKTLVLDITGMTCEHCQRAVTDALGAIPGVSVRSVDLDRHKATVDFADAAASMSTFACALRSAGYGLAGFRTVASDPPAS